MFEKERKCLQTELKSLNKFKTEKVAEQKNIKKAEKKSRQRDKKQIKGTLVAVNSDYKDQNSNDTLENNSDIAMNIKTKPSDQHMRDAFKEAEIEDSEDVDREASETGKFKSVSNQSNSLFSSPSAPVTVNDLEDWLKRVTEPYKT